MQVIIPEEIPSMVLSNMDAYPNKEVNYTARVLQRLAASGDEGRGGDCWTERDAYYQIRHRVRSGPEGR